MTNQVKHIELVDVPSVIENMHVTGKTLLVKGGRGIFVLGIDSAGQSYKAWVAEGTHEFSVHCTTQRGGAFDPKYYTLAAVVDSNVSNIGLAESLASGLQKQFNICYPNQAGISLHLATAIDRLQKAVTAKCYCLQCSLPFPSDDLVDGVCDDCAGKQLDALIEAERHENDASEESTRRMEARNEN